MSVRAAFGCSTRKLTFSPLVGGSFLLSLATAAMAAVVFVVDVMTPPDVAVAVLYVAVVLVAGRFCQTRGIALTAAGCALLTLLAWFHGCETPVNAAIAILAIGVTALLVIRGRSAEHAVRRSERDLQDARMELAHVARVTCLGQLTASIAHEVNQPLSAVIMNAGTGLRWLSAEPPNLAEARHALASIARDGGRASDVIGRIRALAKKDPIPMDRFDLNDSIREVVALTDNEIARNRIALKMKLADQGPQILGDRVQLQQVILNLIINAVEAMNDSEPRELSIETRTDDGGDAFISVSDSGSGLDETKADRLFEPFYSTKPDGMGMGLSICRSIIEAHRGTISARPNNERGSTFEFRIPIAAELAAAAE